VSSSLAYYLPVRITESCQIRPERPISLMGFARPGAGQEVGDADRSPLAQGLTHRDAARLNLDHLNKLAVKPKPCSRLQQYCVAHVTAIS
jgi:hypothetical protein